MKTAIVAAWVAAVRLEGLAGDGSAEPLVGGVCPHDDHHWVGYAAVGYSLAAGSR